MNCSIYVSEIKFNLSKRVEGMKTEILIFGTPQAYYKTRTKLPQWDFKKHEELMRKYRQTCVDLLDRMCTVQS